MRLDARVRAYLAGPPLGGARMYAAPTPLAVGEGVPGGSLARKLDRLGYRPVGDPAHALAPGEYRAAGTTIEFAERPSPVSWAAAPRRVRVGLDGARVTEIEDLEGGALDRLELEPEVLAVLGGGGATLGASPELPPPACRSAVLAAEDRHFFFHPGVDPLAIARALVADLRAHAVAQGASTLTQQLVKNAFLSPRRTLSRKLREGVLALLLEARASKEEILARYVGSVYLGVDGGLPVHGFSEAAQVYFGKPLGELEPAECALLAGIIRSPNGLSPRRRPRPALARRNRVLEVMVQDGLLEKSVGAAAMATPLNLVPPRARAPPTGLGLQAVRVRGGARPHAPGCGRCAHRRLAGRGRAALGARRRAGVGARQLRRHLRGHDPARGRARRVAQCGHRARGARRRPRRGGARGRGPGHRLAAAARAGPGARGGGDLAPRADRGLRRVRARRRAPAPDARRRRRLRRRRDALRRAAGRGARPRPGRRLSRHPSPRGRDRPRHRPSRARGGPHRLGRGQDGHDRRHPRRVVRRLHARGGGRRLGGARRRRADRAHGRAGSAPHLDRLRARHRVDGPAPR